MIFTPVSTVWFEFGNGGPRRTCFTLNRLAPAEPAIAAGKVTFAGRQACLHTTLSQLPELIACTEQHEQAEGIRQLVWECPADPVGFALSNGSCRFTGDWQFADDSGTYLLHLHPDWLAAPNPGNFSIDTFWLAKKTRVTRV